MRRRIRSTRRARPNTNKVRKTYGFPDRMITKVNYRDVIRMDIPSTGSWYDFRLNSLYDPDKSSTGHQPMWTDQYQAIYTKYRVFAAKYTIKIVLLNGTTPAQFTALATDAISPPTGIGQADEVNRAFTKVAPGDPSNVTVLSGNVNLAKLKGLNSGQYRADEYNAATFGNNPINPATLRIFGLTLDGNEATFMLQTKITYYVECYDRVVPLPS